MDNILTENKDAASKIVGPSVFTDRQTDRHIHEDENNTCSKTKFFGQVKINYTSGDQ